MLCPNCGQSCEVVQVSPDYEATDHRAFVNRAQIVQFFFDSDVVDRFMLSPEFMAEHEIHGDVFPLPDEYPAWVKLLKVQCRNCFDARGVHEKDRPPL